MITDPIGDFLTRVRNAAVGRQRKVTAPYSKFKAQVAQVLAREGYLEDVKKEGGNLVVTLTFYRRQPIIMGVKNISSPGLRIYRKAKRLPSPLSGAGISIISTPKGVMSNRQARKKGLGGQVLGEIW